MTITTQLTPLSEVRADWLIVGLWEDAAPSPALLALDAKLGNKLIRLRERGDITGEANELVHLLEPTGAAAERLLVVGLGEQKTADRARLVDAAAAAARSVTGKKTKRLAFALPEGYPGLSWQEMALLAGVGLLQGCQGPGLHQSEPKRFAPQELCLAAPPSAPEEDLRQGVRAADVEGRAVWLARELVNSPPSDLYPESFAERARKAAAAVGVACDILDEKQLATERMGALLGVAQGSDRPPRLVVLRYQK
ncbi:MAG: hypothetical protein JO112_19245, partial [Planctomycetes bacterium]|nr:hypothetical protein [Planctomycetota bacterium]